MAAKKNRPKIPNIVVISDTHFGSRLALCHPDGASLDDGGFYKPSAVQLKLWAIWEEFWTWVEKTTEGEPFWLVHNGDVVEGVHHGDTSNWSTNLNDQCNHAELVMKPVVDLAEGRYFQIRGTAAHVGQQAKEEEALAKRLGAIPNEEGQYARWELWKRLEGQHGGLVHFLHHIGTTSSGQHETSALNAEIAAIYTDCGRYGKEPPRIVVRSHRHRCSQINLPTRDGYACCFVTPAWQLKTQLAWRVAGARVTTPQIGGSVIRLGHDEMYTRHFVIDIERSKEE